MITTVGVGVELLGIALTAAGLVQTWSDHADDDSFHTALRRDLGNLARWILRRPGSGQTISIHAADDISIVGPAHVKQGFPPDATTEEKVDQLKRELDRMAVDAGQALHQARRTAQDLATAEKVLNDRILSLRTETDARLRVITLHGLPLAVLGLVLIGLGTVTQWGASTFM